MFPPASFADTNLESLTICKAVSLGLERGNCDASCFAYVLLARKAGSRFGDYRAGFRFGQLGLRTGGPARAKTLRGGHLFFLLALRRALDETRAGCQDSMRRVFWRIGSETCCMDSTRAVVSTRPFSSLVSHCPKCETKLNTRLALAEKGAIRPCDRRHHNATLR